jgi:hypothetical protein
MEFHAFLRTATPLRILRRHGQVVPLGSPLAEDYEPWMGMWAPKTKTFREIGIDMDESDKPLVASSAGPVKASETLPLLIAIREAAEDPTGGTEARVSRVRAVCSKPEAGPFVATQGGMEAVCDCLFPPVLPLVHGLPRTSQAELRRRGLATVAALRGASDAALLAVDGIGPAKLKAIRGFCAGYDGDPEVEREANLSD